jgi:phosphoribosylamine--glycine ligase
MKVLLVGGGGRENALAWKIAQSPLVDRLIVTHANPGFPVNAEFVKEDPLSVAKARGVGLVVVGPEAPLAEGLSDRLREAGFLVFAPSQAAAQLETSKEFAKAFMDRHAIPTAGWSCHGDRESAHAAVTGPCVVKADGLAAGKGVIVASSAEEAHEAIDSMFEGAFGEAGHRVVIEELLTGPEVSFLAFCDGTRAVPMLPCRDHKRRFDGDGGPNTGGMGAICPPPDVDSGMVDEVLHSVLQKTVDGMASEGMPFKGVLYAGLMLTPAGPRVLEFNVRFGDPECQPLMMMLDEDIVPVMLECASGDLKRSEVAWRDGAACCVVMVSGGYPGPIEKGHPITGVSSPSDKSVVFYAGAQREGDTIVNSGGRVLGVTAFGGSLSDASALAYQTVQNIHFHTADWRKDIGGGP